jgi:RND family efflux transporter MFP subunit
MKKKWIILIIVFLLLGISGWAVYKTDYFKSSSPDSTLEAIKAELRDIQLVVQCTGETTPERMTEIKAEISGQIAQIKVRSGDQVSKGQVLVELDRRELESQLNEATLQIELTELRREKAKLDYERKQKLYDEKLVTTKEFEDARIDSSLATKEYQLDQARLETLKQKLSKTTIRAPYDGMILNVDVQEGSVIVGANSLANGTSMMRIADLRQLIVKTDINEVDVAKVSLGMPVKLTFDSIQGISAEGKITFVSPSALARDPNQKDMKGFPIVVSFPATDARIRPGITANLKIPISNVSQVVSLPISVVFLEEDKNVVFVKNTENKYERRPIEVGLNDARFIQIVSGLNSGDEVTQTRPAELAPPPKKKKL